MKYSLCFQYRPLIVYECYAILIIILFKYSIYFSIFFDICPCIIPFLEYPNTPFFLFSARSCRLCGIFSVCNLLCGDNCVIIFENYCKYLNCISCCNFCICCDLRICFIPSSKIISLSNWMFWYCRITSMCHSLCVNECAIIIYKSNCIFVNFINCCDSGIF